MKIGIGYHGERPNITNPYVTRKVSKIIVHEGFNFKTLVSTVASCFRERDKKQGEIIL